MTSVTENLSCKIIKIRLFEEIFLFPEKNCGNAGEVFHGDVQYPEGSEFGAVLKVTCNPGLVMK